MALRARAKFCEGSKVSAPSAAIDERQPAHQQQPPAIGQGIHHEPGQAHLVGREVVIGEASGH